jgi:hypothetical protein
MRQYPPIEPIEKQLVYHHKRGVAVMDGRKQMMILLVRIFTEPSRRKNFIVAGSPCFGMWVHGRSFEKAIWRYGNLLMSKVYDYWSRDQLDLLFSQPWKKDFLPPEQCARMIDGIRAAAEGVLELEIMK